MIYYKLILIYFEINYIFINFALYLIISYYCKGDGIMVLMARSLKRIYYEKIIICQFSILRNVVRKLFNNNSYFSYI